MDHLPRVQGSACPEILVPCHCTEDYDGLGFTDYPLRKGWNSGTDGRFVLGNRPREVQAPFLQTWLFFGMLDQVLGRRIPLDDFVKDGYVTTTRLPEYMREWYGKVQGMSVEERKDQYLRAQSCLLEARSRCLLLLDETMVDCPLGPEVRLSIRILGESLSNAMFQIWHFALPYDEIMAMPEPKDIRGRWGHSKILVDEMLDRNWCASDVVFLQHYPPASSNSGMYYARSLLRSSSESHSQCGKRTCALLQVNSRAYRQRHCVLSPIYCDETCAHITPSQDDVRSILRSGGIPILKVAGRIGMGNNVSFEVVRLTEGMEYTAISHLWSDGFGNPRSNSILGCQAAFLVHSMAAMLEANQEAGTEKAEVFFWIDTLLVPTGPASNDAKNLALERMGDTYQKAAKVLVVDASMCQKQPADNLEAVMECLCSKWMRRLWTLQEGVLGEERLYILFKNGAWDLWKGLQQLRKERDEVPWTSHSLLSFTTRLGLANVVKSQGTNRISWLFKDMSWRSTSVSTDEALVFASLTGQNPQALLQVAPDERMKKAISMTNTLPSRIVFCPGSRFEEEGYRWALRTFLSPSNFTLVGYEIRPNFSPEKGPLGVTITYPGYLLNETVVCADLAEFLLFDSEAHKWLKVKRPLEPLSNETAPAVEPSASQTRSGRRPVGLILLEAPWISRHAYGALVSLDQLDARERPYDTLSTLHEGVFDVFVADFETPGDFDSRHIFSTASMLKQQKWVVR